MYWRVVVAAVAGLVVQGCGDSDGPKYCTLAACVSNVYVQIDPPFQQAAEYEVEVVADAEHHDCTVLISSDGGDAGTTGYEAECSSDTIHAWGQPGAGLGIVRLDETPRHVALTIRQDGELVLSESFDPQYQTHHPNGPECEPTCRIATHSVSEEP